MREIGKTFKYGNIRLNTIESSQICDGCYFQNSQGGCLANRDNSIICFGYGLNRKKSVIFVLVKFTYGK
jgi:hypothetical protein